MKVVSINSKKKEIGNCLGCAIVSGKIDHSKAEIIVTRYFNVHQDYEIPIEGFLIVSTKRHIMSIADFTEEEQKEFIRLICKLRKGMKEALKIKEVYLFQNEDTIHHFHLWMFPRLKWMEKFGRKIESVRPIMKYAQQYMKTEKNLERIDKTIKKIKDYMKNFK